jgi:hypothetical protein
METFLIGLAGGIAPAIVVICVYFLGTAGRLAKMETDISWLKGELTGCRLRSKDRI